MLIISDRPADPYCTLLDGASRDDDNAVLGSNIAITTIIIIIDDQHHQIH